MRSGLVYVPSRDMVRIAYLMLHNGAWQGKALLPGDWLKQITTPVTDYRETVKNHSDYFNLSYGYCWWIWNQHTNNKFYQGAYTASGAFGQFITVLSALDIVIAHITFPGILRQMGLQRRKSIAGSA